MKSWREQPEAGSRNGSRVLLLSCSQRKRPDRKLLSAIDRYDGPAFRVLRRYFRETRDNELQVYILSGHFGVIDSRTRIPDYNRRMTAARAREIRQETTGRMELILRRHRCSEMFVCTSVLYQVALDESRVRRFSHLRFAARGQGTKLASLHSWLRERSNG